MNIWKKNGNGKEYDIEVNLIFEGEYFNYIKWNGKGKEIKDGDLIIEIEYLNGKRIYKIFHFYI